MVDGVPVQYEGEVRQVISLVKEHDVVVPWNLGDEFRMSR